MFLPSDGIRDMYVYTVLFSGGAAMRVRRAGLGDTAVLLP